MAETEPTPEENLLRHIRKHPPPKKSETPAPRVGAVSLPAVSLAGMEKGSGLARTVQMGLAAVIGINLLAFGGGIVAHRARLQQINQLEREFVLGPTEEIGKISSAKPVSPPEPAEPFESYAQTFQTKQLFRYLAAPPVPKPKSKGPVRNRISELTLTGVVSAPRPQVIIDDSASKKSYFLKKGDAVADLKVIEILEGRVILEIEGERHELAL